MLTKPLSGLSKFALMLMLVMPTAGCTTMMGLGGIDRFYCGVDGEPGAYVPVGWSVDDTDESIMQNKANNAVYLDRCGKPL